ncbi:chromosomal replication initiator protein DnaA [bacterium]|nr:chromosomal replication initiator protein DnaA [bacterium]
MRDDPKRIWEYCLTRLQDKINPQSFKTWFSSATALPNSADGTLVIRVKNLFVAEWIEQHYLPLVSKFVSEVAQENLKISFAYPLHDGTLAYIIPTKGKEANNFKEERGRFLNPRFRFDSFVVGDFNRMAYTAALAVAEAPGKTKYNPLFIYGGVGLGKTHLIQAIGNFIAEEDPGKKVIYATSEKFTYNFINALSRNRIQEFTRAYRSVDVLLMDDIQFLSGKESTQGQFFHTFNALHQVNHQIVLTADCPPEEIDGIEERLLSRFKWGLVVDIKPPDFESRVAILKNKAEFDNLDLSDSVIEYIAHNITSNIRALEGALIKLIAHASLYGREITVDLARKVLSQKRRVSYRGLTISDIQRQVARYFDLQENSLCEKKRTKDIAFARQLAMYLSRTLTSSSLKSIGLRFGGRDHSTVVHACNKIEDLIKRDEKVRRMVEEIRDSLTHGPSK